MPSPFIIQKATALRRALIESGIVASPNPNHAFAELPEDRQAPWLALAAFYHDLFATHEHNKAARYLITIPQPAQLRAERPLIGHTVHILYTKPNTYTAEEVERTLQNWVRNAGNHIWTRSQP